MVLSIFQVCHWTLNLIFMFHINAFDYFLPTDHMSADNFD